MDKPKRTNRLFIFLIPLGVAFVALLLLFKGLDAPVPTPAPPTPTPDPAQEDVARVGEQRITFADWAVAFYLDTLMSRLSGQPVPAANETLDRLVNDTLMLTAAAKEGISATEADAEARIALLEAAWELTDEQVVAELTAMGLTREIWSDTLTRLLIVERYLDQVVWADVPAEEQSEALGDWLQTHRAQTSVEVDTQGLQPSLPTPMPVSSVPTATALPPTATPPATLPLATPTLTPTAIPVATLPPTATPLVASPLATPTPTPTALTVQVSPLQTPVVSPSTPPAVGQPAPDFALTNAEGQLVSLSDYLDQRRVVIVFFRTTG
jgi:hypothetical protein